MTVSKKTERRWEIDDFAAVSEHITGDAREPVVFSFALKVNPVTRQQLEALRDAFNEVLGDVPARRISLLGDVPVIPANVTHP